MNGLSSTLDRLRDWEEAKEVYSRGLNLLRLWNTKFNWQEASLRFELAYVLDQMERQQEAKDARFTLLSLLEAAGNRGEHIWSGFVDQAARLVLMIELEEGETDFHEELQLLTSAYQQAMASENPVPGLFHFVVSKVQERLGQPEEAIRHARLSLENTPYYEVRYRKGQHDLLIRLLLAAGRPEEAKAEHRKALDGMLANLGDDHVITHYVRADFAEFLVGLQEYEEAEELLQQAQQGLLSDARVSTLQQQRVIRLLVQLYERSGKPSEADQWRAKLET